VNRGQDVQPSAEEIAARFRIGLDAYRAGKIQTALSAFEPLAMAGHTGAMYNLAVLLKDSDREAARDWYERAANAGHTGAMNNLAVLLKDSDREAARRWFQRAATADHAEAMNNLRALLARGPFR